MIIRSSISRESYFKEEISDCTKDIKVLLLPHGSDQWIIQPLDSRKFRRRSNNTFHVTSWAMYNNKRRENLCAKKAKFFDDKKIPQVVK